MLTWVVAIVSFVVVRLGIAILQSAQLAKSQLQPDLLSLQLRELRINSANRPFQASFQGWRMLEDETSSDGSDDMHLIDKLVNRDRNMNISFVGSSLLMLMLVMSIPSQSELLAQQAVAPEKIVGRDNCAQCHAAELKAWELSTHGQKAWKLLDHPKAAGFAKAIGVTDIKGYSTCTSCHGTHQIVSGRPKVFQGNSCESCHGGAGGPSGWLSKHYDFGTGRTVDASTRMADLLADRLNETSEHRLERDSACRAAGMQRSENPIGIAKNCLSCHLVPNEELQKAGHPMSASFEMVRWSSGEVRHNFLLDPKTNADVPSNWLDEFRNGNGRTVTGHKRLMYVAGKLADLDLSLRYRAEVSSTKRGTLGDELNDRILDIQEELGEIDVEELQVVLEVIKDVDKKSLRNITDQDNSTYVELADAVAAASEKFVEAHASGDRLPAEIKVRRQLKGRPCMGIE